MSPVSGKRTKEKSALNEIIMHHPIKVIH